MSANKPQIVKPLFLYLTSSAPEKPMIEMLVAAGYVPIAVESFAAVKVVEMIPIGTANTITRAALETIATAQYSSVPEFFGRNVAKALTREEA